MPDKQRQEELFAAMSPADKERLHEKGLAHISEAIPPGEPDGTRSMEIPDGIITFSKELSKEDVAKFRALWAHAIDGNAQALYNAGKAFEREECALLVDQVASYGHNEAVCNSAARLARAIRARK